VNGLPVLASTVSRASSAASRSAVATSKASALAWPLASDTACSAVAERISTARGTRNAISTSDVVAATSSASDRLIAVVD
jgi:hypothetical protein